MDMRQLKTFQTVANLLSFTRAAEVLDYAQSSVTAHIQSLEDEFGVTLFDRLGRRIVLTDAGERLLVYADQMLTIANEALQCVAFESEPVGTLHIAAPETLCTYRLPPLLRQFRHQFPRVRLIFHPILCHQVPQHLYEGTIDVGIIIAQPMQRRRLHIESLVRENLLVLAAPDHPLHQKQVVTPEDLCEELLLLTEGGCSYRLLFEEILRAAGIRLTETMEFSSVEAIKQCTMAGIGVAVLPQIAVAKEIERGELCPVNWNQPDFHAMTQLMWHNDKWMSPALSAFISMTRSLLKSPSLQAA